LSRTAANHASSPVVDTGERLSRGSAPRRIAGLAVAAAAAAVLGFALYLRPDPAGHGTHEQLGLPACNWVGAFETPCPTCGMTTAFSNAVRGRFATSIRAQPMGFLLSIATGGALLLGLYVTATGANLAPLLSRMWGRRILWSLIALLGASWIYKMLDMWEIIQ